MSVLGLFSAFMHKCKERAPSKSRSAPRPTTLAPSTMGTPLDRILALWIEVHLSRHNVKFHARWRPHLALQIGKVIPQRRALALLAIRRGQGDRAALVEAHAFRRTVDVHAACQVDHPWRDEGGELVLDRANQAGLRPAHEVAPKHHVR